MRDGRWRNVKLEDGQDEFPVYRAEAELYLSPGDSQARVRRKTTWFDRLGQIQNEEHAEWVGPVTSLLGVDGEPARDPSACGTVKRPKPDRVADLVLALAVLVALAAGLRLLLPG